MKIFILNDQSPDGMATKIAQRFYNWTLTFRAFRIRIGLKKFKNPVLLSPSRNYGILVS